MRNLLRAGFGIGALIGFLASSAAATSLNYAVVVSQSDINTRLNAGASFDINPDPLNAFPQFGTLTSTSTTKPATSSHAVADVGLPGSFNNGANGISISQLTWTTQPANLDGFGIISTPLLAQLVGFTAKVASLTLSLDPGSTVTSSLTPTGNPNEWLWAGTGNVTLSGTIAPTVTIPTVQTIELGPYPFSQAIVNMPLAGTFSADANGSDLTLLIPTDTLQNQALGLPPINVPVDLAPLVTGQVSISSLNLVDVSTAIVYHNNASPIPEPGTALLLGIGLVGLALARRR